MPENEFEMTIVTRWSDIDANQHMRNTAYSELSTYVRSEWLASRGFGIRELMEINFSTIIFEDSTKYVKEVFLGEHITVNIKSVGYKHDGSQWHVRHTFRRSGTVVAIHDVKGAWLDVAARRIAAPPAGLMKAATNLPRTSDYAEIVSRAK